MVQMDYGEIEEVLGTIFGEKIGFESMIRQAIDGGNLFDVSTWIGRLREVFVQQIQSQRQLLGALFGLMIMAAILTVVSKAFRNKQISEMGFLVIFLLLFLILMKSFQGCFVITENVIHDLIDFIKVLMPAYLMAAALGAYRTSAVMYYEGFLLLIYYLQKMISVLLLPAIRGYVLVGMLGYLGKEDVFTKGKKYLKSMILFVLKAMISVTAGLQMIQGMLTPAIDHMKHTIFTKGVSSLGTIGNVAENVTDVILGSGTLLKNGIGVVGSVMIVSICLVPVVQVSAYLIFYRVLTVITEPFSDKRILGMIEHMGDGIGLLVKLLFTLSALFLLTIAIVCVTTGGIR